MRTTIQKLTPGIKLIAVILLVLATISSVTAATWSAPSGATFANNVSKPIDESASIPPQIRAGLLGVYGFGSTDRGYFSTSTYSAFLTSNLLLGINGKVGADSLCDATGRNCVTPAQINGGQMTIPKGAVMPFNATQCPTGWNVANGLAGRSVVGAGASGSGSSVGTALTDKENRPTGAHTHPIFDMHSHTTDVGLTTESKGGNNSEYKNVIDDSGTTQTSLSYAGKGHLIINPAGDVPGTNAPYVQLLYCLKGKAGSLDSFTVKIGSTSYPAGNYPQRSIPAHTPISFSWSTTNIVSCHAIESNGSLTPPWSSYVNPSGGTQNSTTTAGIVDSIISFSLTCDDEIGGGNGMTVRFSP